MYYIMFIHSCVGTLLENLKSTKIRTDPKLRKEYEKDSDFESKKNSFDDFQYDLKPMHKNTTVFLHNAVLLTSYIIRFLTIN